MIKNILYRYVLVLLNAVFLLACKPESVLQTQKASPIKSDQKDLPPLMFTIFESSICSAESECFEAIGAWNSAERTNRGAHIFVDPANAQKLKKMKENGVAGYAVEQSGLKKLWSDIVTKNPDRNRLVLFLATHGLDPVYGKQTAGNLCYKSHTSCDFSAEDLINALDGLKVSAIKEILLIPLSCFNRYFIERTKNLVEQKAWPFSVSYLSLTDYETACTLSSAYQIFSGSIENSYELPDDRISKIFAAQSLKLLLPELNETFSPDVGVGRFELIAKKDLLLSDFSININSITAQESFDKIELMPTVGEYLDKKSLFKNNRHRIAAIQIDNYKLEINGDMNKKFNPSLIENDNHDIFIKFRKEAF